MALKREAANAEKSTRKPESSKPAGRSQEFDAKICGRFANSSTSSKAKATANPTMMRPETTIRSQRVLSDTKEVTDKIEDAQESPQPQEDSGSFQAKQSRKRSRGQEDENEETGNTSKRCKRARPSLKEAARPAGRTVQSQRQRKKVPDEMEDIRQSPEPEERSGLIQPKRSRKRARDQEDEGDQDESTSDKRKRARTTPEEASYPAQKTVQPRPRTRKLPKNPYILN
jgi:hypothetical protein